MHFNFTHDFIAFFVCLWMSCHHRKEHFEIYSFNYWELFRYVPILGHWKWGFNRHICAGFTKIFFKKAQCLWHLREQLTGHLGGMFNFKSTVSCLSKWHLHPAFPWQRIPVTVLSNQLLVFTQAGCKFLIPLPQSLKYGHYRPVPPNPTVILSFIKNHHNRCVMVYRFYFCLQFPNKTPSLHKLICCLFQYPCPSFIHFESCYICFLLVEFWELFLYFWYSPLSATCLSNTCFVFWVIFHEVGGFNFSKV